MWLIAAEWPLLTVQRSVASQEDEWQVSASTVIELQNLTGCSQPEAAFKCKRHSLNAPFVGALIASKRFG